jgi:protein TonB
MKVVGFLLLLWLTESQTALAQRLPEKSPAEDNVYISADVMPSFPGGQEALRRYLKENLMLLPDSTHTEKGKVVASFIISEEGNVSGTRILKGLSENTDAAVLKAIKNMPAWEPGKVAREPVKVRVSLPVEIPLR